MCALAGWTYTHGCLTARGCTPPRGGPRRVSRAKIVQGASGRIVLDANHLLYCQHTNIVRIWCFYSKESTSGLLGVVCCCLCRDLVSMPPRRAVRKKRKLIFNGLSVGLLSLIAFKILCVPDNCRPDAKKCAGWGLLQYIRCAPCIVNHSR